MNIRQCIHHNNINIQLFKITSSCELVNMFHHICEHYTINNIEKKLTILGESIKKYMNIYTYNISLTKVDRFDNMLIVFTYSFNDNIDNFNNLMELISI